MKKILFICLIALATFFVACDKDECPVCHECECVCPVGCDQCAPGECKC